MNLATATAQQRRSDEGLLNFGMTSPSWHCKKYWPSKPDGQLLASCHGKGTS